MTRYTLTVPLQDNDGELLGRDVFTRIEERILDTAGGFTFVHGIGAWRGADTTYREPVRLYHIDADEDIAAPLRLLAADIALQLAQEAVYLTAQEVAAELVYAPAIA